VLVRSGVYWKGDNDGGAKVVDDNLSSITSRWRSSGLLHGRRGWPGLFRRGYGRL